MESVKVIRQGRGGYVLYEGYQYTIDHVEAGHFCIHFPSGHRHKNLQEHFDALKSFAQRHEPPWSIRNSLKH